MLKILERVRGIEPLSWAWKAPIIPLYYTRPVVNVLVERLILKRKDDISEFADFAQYLFEARTGVTESPAIVYGIKVQGMR